ncbi:conserved hypothetical protein [Tolumonas auensis DSM 9187]|uniref:DUF4440 domain-containing protein n=1 Tax=Tolumonas auensis (strain DSM 9187 / NBRC 110442 / TA 4) TaxID=595494 RepID=C4LFP6_TOLAT|nr:nuclear transport factor 2 family protein [Tolumonas auensis]ACQ93413.1 conserved hypothetical protein [Tolumonas auensis DSM 9187]NCB58822.1 nuclear transport factor 2 family protein [Gammaproteobacteria bacterium]
MFKKMLCVASICSAAWFVPVANAQNTDVVSTAEQLRIQMVEPSENELNKLVLDDLSYGHSSGRLDTKESFIGDLMKGKSDFVTLNITDQTAKVTGDTAVIRHTLTATTNDSGKPGNVSLKVLQVWQKQAAGEWKLLARQAVRINP